MSMQLPLDLRLEHELGFDAFVPGANEMALNLVRRTATGKDSYWSYLWGASGTGKSHLLNAAAAQAAAAGRSAVVLPLAQAGDWDCESLSGMESMGLVCIDDLQVIAGRREWELALFSLVNRLREANGSLIVTGNAPPSELNLSLPDLRSRLGWGAVLPLQALDDDDKCQSLLQRARLRGFALPEEVLRYLMQRAPRDMHALMALLDRVEGMSLSRHRAITLPLVREALEAQRGAGPLRGKAKASLGGRPGQGLKIVLILKKILRRRSGSARCIAGLS